MRKKTIVMLSVIAFSAQADDNFYRSDIEKRIRPVGQVRVQKEASQSAAVVSLPKEEQKPVLSGEKIYQQYCSVCHQSGVAGAPKFRDQATWDLRLSQKNIAELTSSVIKGLNAMPAKGTCMSCTEDDIRKAVEYMVPKQ